MDSHLDMISKQTLWEEQNQEDQIGKQINTEMIIQTLVFLLIFKFCLVFRASGAAIAVSVLSGAAAERMTFLAWSILTIVYAGFIYAGLAHWTLASGWYYIN